MSRNPQVFLTIVPLTTIYVWEDINWSLMLPTHEKQKRKQIMWGKGLGIKYSNRHISADSSDHCLNRNTTWKSGRTRNAVATRAAGECFRSPFEFSQTFTSVLELDRNVENVFSISFRKHRDEKRKTLVHFDYQNVDSLCLRYHNGNSSC